MTVRQCLHINPAEDFWVIKVAGRHFSINKVDFEGKVDIVNIVDNMDMADNVNMVGSIDMMNMQKAFPYLYMLVNT